MIFRITINIVVLLTITYNVINANNTIGNKQDVLIAQSNKIVNDLDDIPQLRAIAISKNGEMITEKYFNGEPYYPHDRLHIMSVTKSIISLLVGIAIDRGFIKSVDQTISELISIDDFKMNDNFSKITMKQLLTMQAGFEWNFSDPSEYRKWILNEDQVEYIFNKPFIEEPGKKFSYNDGAAHLLSVIISETTNMSTLEFANKFLFAQIGIGPRNWYIDNRGYNMGGVCLILSVQDMIKIGELVLNDGIYNGTQVISKEWIDESTSKQTQAGGHIPYSNEYGYYWWLGEMHGMPYILAMGYGGQFIFIFKELDLVITTLCDYSDGDFISFSNSDEIHRAVSNLISNYSNNIG